MTLHHLDDSVPHAFWDHDHPPRIAVDPGDIVVFETLEGLGQISRQSDHAALADPDFTLTHPLTGPVFVTGAEPGDVLDVEVISLEHKGWGWNGVVPGFGLLADEFPDPYIHHYELDGDSCLFRPDIVIPFEPFCGIMGVAPAEAGRLNTWPPRGNAGNVDIRHLTAGTVVRLPVLVPGALFSCGDCHAAQGDGEVNGTGVESPMTVRLGFTLTKAEALPELQFVTAPGRPLTRARDRGYFVTTAHGPDLYVCAQTAVRYMIDHLESTRELTRAQAYCLCGAAVDLKISEIVDAPNWIVSAYLPLGIFS